MRLLLVPASAIVLAWSFPAGLFTGSFADHGVVVAPIPDRATDARGWHESDAGTQRPDISAPVNAFYSQPSSLDLAEMAFEAAPNTDAAISMPTPGTMIGDALAALSAVVRRGLGQQAAIPLPPHRAVPHEIVCEALEAAAERNKVPAPFLIRLIWQESGFNQNAVSPVGAQGVAQFMPETASSRGLDDPFNPLQSVRASARLLRDLIDRFGNLGLAAAAYNAGSKRVQDWLAKRGSLPQETRDYVKRITGLTAEDWTAKSILPVALQVPEKSPCQHESGVFAADGDPAQIPMPPNPPAIVAKAETKTETKVEAKAQVRTEAKIEAKIGAKAGTKHEAKAAKPIVLAEATLPASPERVENAKAAPKSEMHARTADASAGKAKTVTHATAEATVTKTASAKTRGHTAARPPARHSRTASKAAKAKPVHVADAKVRN
ncbi:MAG: hypothetical protein OJF62_002711 [Pseudolabrys sp.]|nr:hypothetical protein [Pseudolabrys sp.]